ncbi:hypothetical protein Tco_0691406 [Tanacetum coccineum]
MLLINFESGHLPRTSNTTINLSPRTWRFGTPTFGTQIVNVLFFSLFLLVILENYATKKATAKVLQAIKRLIAQHMVDMLFHLERNEIRDADNESRINTLETNHVNEGHAFRLEYHLGTTQQVAPLHISTPFNI